jgi:predicted DNA binding CopG/RHH family protein
MKKPLPELTTDEEAEDFIANADLTEYDWSGMKMVRFELMPKSESITMRLPSPFVTEIKRRAAQAGIPYQRAMRVAMAAGIDAIK